MVRISAAVVVAVALSVHSAFAAPMFRNVLEPRGKTPPVAASGSDATSLTTVPVPPTRSQNDISFATHVQRIRAAMANGADVSNLHSPPRRFPRVVPYNPSAPHPLQDPPAHNLDTAATTPPTQPPTSPEQHGAPPK